MGKTPESKLYSSEFLGSADQRHSVREVIDASFKRPVKPGAPAKPPENNIYGAAFREKR